MVDGGWWIALLLLAACSINRFSLSVENQMDRELKGGLEVSVLSDFGEELPGFSEKISLNEHDLGFLWKRPFRLEISSALKQGTNVLRIEVANTWANGLAGNARLPADQRRTRTNVTCLPNA